jgi:hypothetical protein
MRNSLLLILFLNNKIRFNQENAFEMEKQKTSRDRRRKHILSYHCVYRTHFRYPDKKHSFESIVIKKLKIITLKITYLEMNVR